MYYKVIVLDNDFICAVNIYRVILIIVELKNYNYEDGR
nr:MAG TPA: hypothetical protein [Crassvirales sp.]